MTGCRHLVKPVRNRIAYPAIFRPVPLVETYGATRPHCIGRAIPRFGDDWWRRGVVYQIYPRSFADTDGDGVGDLPGIIAHLDHLGPDGLGVDAIWLSPIYPSPGLDLGYDVSDHERVDPLFGTEDDFDRLVAEAHRRGIRVVLDLVMNHTSDAHRWFGSSSDGRTGPHADWYLWRDAAGVGPDGERLPPNNWVSWFGGSGWEWEPAREQFYFHTFLAEQPELDWRAPGVEDAQFEMVRGWLERGVDGFRLDTFNCFLKHPDLPSNPTRPGSTAWTRQVHIYDRDQPDLPELIGRFRAIVDSKPRAACRSGSCSTARSRRPPACDRPASGLRLGTDRDRVDRAMRSGRPSSSAKRHSAATAGRRPSCPTTTSRATRRASPDRSARPTRMPSPAPPPSCC